MPTSRVHPSRSGSACESTVSLGQSRPWEKMINDLCTSRQCRTLACFACVLLCGIAVPAEAETVTAYRVVLKGFSGIGERAERDHHETLIGQQRLCAEAMRQAGQSPSPVTADLDPTPRPSTLEILATHERMVTRQRHEGLALTEGCGLQWQASDVLTIETASGPCRVDLIRHRSSGICAGIPPLPPVPRKPVDTPSIGTRTIGGQVCQVYAMPLSPVEICLAQDGPAARLPARASNSGSRPGILLEQRNTRTGDVMRAESVEPEASVPASALQVPADIPSAGGASPR